MALHLHPHTVRFSECDPAGVVYYPRYFDWFHQAMETWFDDALGLGFAETFRRCAMPTVHTEADYQRPCRLSERVTVELALGELRRASYRLDYRVLGPEGDARLTGATVCASIAVVAGEARFKSVPLPEDIRAVMERFREG